MTIRLLSTLSFTFLLTFLATTASTQPLIEGTEELDFDDPQSWAMKYYASLALLTGMGVPEAMGLGKISLGFEGGIVPQLSEEDRRVGFDGTKVEDLNRTHLFGRVRGKIGLSEAVFLELSYLPPIELDGVKPHMFSVAVGRPFSVGEAVQIGLRGYGHFGSIEGDITCSAQEIEEGENEWDCVEPSNDDLSQRAFGAEITTGFGSGTFRPYVGFAVNYMDLEFQIDAFHSGVHDRTLELTDGTTVYVNGGFTYAAGEKWRMTGELFYSPLSVVRPPETSSQNDALFNFRFLVAYQIN
jgi:hypothetical protein